MSQNKKALLLSVVLALVLLKPVILINNPKTLGQTTNQIQSNHVLAAVIPHHLVAKTLVDDLTSILSSQCPKDIYLLGPNHFEVGDSDLISDILFLPSIVSVNPDVVKKDHAVTPIKQILNQDIDCHPQVIPVLISSRATQAHLNILKDYLVNQTKNGSLIVASIDFSHDLTLTQANLKDVQTKKIISQKDYSQISKFTNQNLDSPKSLTLLMQVLDQNFSYHINFLKNTNSQILINSTDLDSTTSHILITFTN